MAYPVLLILHLFAALAFAGTVFFEVVMLEGVRKHVPREAMRLIESAIGARARRVVPWILLVLYGAGLGLAWQHRAALAQPLASSFGLLLGLKIVLAVSVFGHFLTAMALQRRGRLNGRNSRRIHISVFCHVVLIVLLAKAMFYLHW
ncbi:CopD family copper resistance protein [Bordetella petrii]|uniref:Membrane protein n=1 Tax=Bordetella petrii (strain ATCC BAA-461 / DSM 12804 / CCUG 43448 / CIP 107267 / Se-1111R) TaxID=340100 RepID=A9IFA7_BORPD|nr:membrane protein [Bordetella petrii]CAP45003.1 putative membrane protein [Bordetella petrii]